MRRGGIGVVIFVAATAIAGGGAGDKKQITDLIGVFRKQEIARKTNAAKIVGPAGFVQPHGVHHIGRTTVSNSAAAEAEIGVGRVCQRASAIELNTHAGKALDDTALRNDDITARVGQVNRGIATADIQASCGKIAAEVLKTDTGIGRVHNINVAYINIARYVLQQDCGLVAASGVEIAQANAA